ncbi:MAG: hypothetical protein R3E42_01370 [Burkholderiaceae bacterium]
MREPAQMAEALLLTREAQALSQDVSDQQAFLNKYGQSDLKSGETLAAVSGF